ncbi:MAG TPA: serine--tRNA ligase [candidate division Zixibacteria bacterium]|nr:serine--tRNA ligase [candidate division Zixibacteria bacterium]
MLDIKFIRENAEAVSKACIDKNEPDIIGGLLSIDGKRREIQQAADELRHKQKDISAKVGEAFKSGDKEIAQSLKVEAKELSDRVKELEEEQRNIEADFEAFMLRVPNIPSETAPVGGEDANVIISHWGEVPRLNFEPRDHIDLGDILGILDMERGAKVAGRAFPLLKGDGARMSRALVALMMDLHRAAGFKEIAPPFLANRDSMVGSAQLPKLEEDMYHIPTEDFFLIPTSEVPVTNLHSGEVLSESDLPIYYAGFSANFRREAGSYGADTRGLLRVHQFDKVEIVKFVHPDTSAEEHESLREQAELVLKTLSVPYRVKLLATGDMSFASHKIYDLEIWAAGEQRWLEVSSCTNFLDFQARRANIRFRPDDGGALRFVHTLNASGVALPRLLVALWENNQTDRGTIIIPEPLRPYMGGQKEIEAG